MATEDFVRKCRTLRGSVFGWFCNEWHPLGCRSPSGASPTNGPGRSMHCPNGTSHTSGNGWLSQRDIAYQPRGQPWEGAWRKGMRSEGTPHRPAAGGWGDEMRRSFRTRESAGRCLRAWRAASSRAGAGRVASCSTIVVRCQVKVSFDSRRMTSCVDELGGVGQRFGLSGAGRF